MIKKSFEIFKRMICLVITALLLISASGCKTDKDDYEEPQKKPSGAYIDTDGNAYLEISAGTLSKIPGRFGSVTATVDREHIILLGKDGSLSVRSEDADKPVDENVYRISEVRDDSVIYVKVIFHEKGKERYFLPEESTGDEYPPGLYDEYSFFRYSYGDDGPVSLGPYEYFVTASDTGSVLDVVRDHSSLSLFCLDAGEKNVRTVCDYGSVTGFEVIPICISGDGSFMCFSECRLDEEVPQGEARYKVYIVSNGEKKTVLELDEKRITDAGINDDGDFAVIRLRSQDTMYLWDKEDGIIPVHLPGRPNFNHIFSDKGNIDVFTDYHKGCLYARIKKDNDLGMMCSVSPDGKSEILADDIRSFDIRNGHTAYLTKERHLFIAGLDDGRLSDTVKAAEGVLGYMLSPKGDSVIYLTDADGETGKLWYRSFDQDGSTLISDSCYAYRNNYGLFDDSYSELRAYFTSDGKGVLYFTDSKKCGYSYSGTLCIWDTVKKESTAIDTDVSTFLETGYKDGSIKRDSISYLKCSDSYEEDKYVSSEKMLCSLMHWNGKKSETAADKIAVFVW
ncbi:MAG: hypothetical protein IKI74_00885 [Christensenellaceae bacterium]|nr:hypothetical protein [Christensenellaceae bacterium]